MILTLEEIVELENELKKRWAYHYSWGRKQNDNLDHQTRFVYSIRSREKCVSKIKEYVDRENIEDKKWIFNYAANRRYNFRSAQWIENLFKLHPNVVGEQDEYHQFIDFYINWIPFDHKTSKYPKEYNKPIEFAKQNKWDLIDWLYKNQSKQQRFHMKNRLFIIVHSLNWEDWKLKAELTFIKGIVDEYLANFNKDKLYSFTYENEEVLSDIIWIEK